MASHPIAQPLYPSVIAWLKDSQLMAEMQEGPEADFHHLLRMAEAIQEVLDGRDDHGGFVTAMAEGDYDLAFRKADGINRRYFGCLMEFRLYYATTRPPQALPTTGPKR